MSPENDLKSLWKQAKEQRKLTLEGASDLLKQKGWGTWGINTVKAAVEGQSKDLREIVLRRVLKEFLGLADSVNKGPAESAQTGVEKLSDRPDDLSLEQWKRKAIQLEERINQVTAICQAPLSSAPSADYRLVKKILRTKDEPELPSESK